MTRGFLVWGSLLTAAMIFLLGSGQSSARGQSAPDLIQANTVWKGEVHQGDEIFPTTIYIQQRNKERIKGELHFTRHGELHKLTFQGNVIDRDRVAWITDKKEGHVTFPGLYIGKVDGKTLAGIWQVPSANQYDRFSVKLAD